MYSCLKKWNKDHLNSTLTHIYETMSLIIFNLHLFITPCSYSIFVVKSFLLEYIWFSLSNYCWCKIKLNKKHSDSADTSTSVTFDLDVWPWPYVKVMKAQFIYMSLIVVYFFSRYDVFRCNSLWDMTICAFEWPLTFTCDLQLNLLHNDVRFLWN